MCLQTGNFIVPESDEKRDNDSDDSDDTDCTWTSVSGAPSVRWCAGRCSADGVQLTLSLLGPASSGLLALGPSLPRPRPGPGNHGLSAARGRKLRNFNISPNNNISGLGHSSLLPPSHLQGRFCTWASLWAIHVERLILAKSVKISISFHFVWNNGRNTTRLARTDKNFE